MILPRAQNIATAGKLAIMDVRFAMSVEQAIAEELRELPEDKQQEVLELVKRLRAENPRPKKPFKSIKGILAGRGISISAEDIDEVRREMWKDFPRQDI
jgi:hypothetical protein